VRAHGAALDDDQASTLLRAGGLVWLYLSPLALAAGGLLASGCLLDEVWHDESSVGVLVGLGAVFGMCAALLFVPLYLVAAVMVAFGSAGSQHGERVMSCMLLSAALASAVAGLFVGLIALL
jgi:hypothetical protein